MIKYIERFVENPYVNFITGLVLIFTSGVEVFESLDEEFKLGVHHGVFVFGILQVLRSLPEFIEGSKSLKEGRSKLK